MDVQSIKANIKEPDPSRNFLIVPENNLQIYFSVDVCNSTVIKTSCNDWYEINKALYDLPFPHMKFWKYNGDEVLYSECFHDINSLITIIEEAYTYIKNMQKEIQGIIKNDKIQVQLKGTIWLARISENFKCNSNIHIRNNLSDEFLGSNIDEGFRLTQKITGSKIVLDPKIVCLFLAIRNIKAGEVCGTLIKNKEAVKQFAISLDDKTIDSINKITEKIYFISYTHLKGIWANRKYPVFWYYRKEIDFSYDEKIDDNYIEKNIVCDAKEWCKKFDNIFNNVGANEEFNKIIELIIGLDKKNIYSLNSFAKLYYTVACINPTSGKIFIAKRSNKRQHLKGVWELIPFKHVCREIVPSVEKCFYDRFGCRITLLTDNEQEQNIIPLHFCTIFRNGEAHNNLLCVATFNFEGEENKEKTDAEIIEIIKSKDGIKDYYSDFRFVDSTEINDFNPITLKEIELDSIKSLSNSSEVYEGNQAMIYFQNSIKAVENYYKSNKLGFNWYNIYSKSKEEI